MPAGWDAELYRNGQLVAFAKSGSNQRYAFEDVELGYGDNRFEIVTFGPQGQQRSRVETINVGQEHVPPGKTYYYVGFNQPGSDLLGFVGDRAEVDRTFGEDRIAVPKVQAAAALEHGLDKRTSVAALAAMMIVGDEKLTFVEGSVRRSIGPALVEASLARQSGGGMAMRGSAIARFGSVNVAAEGVSAQDFFYQGRHGGAPARRPPHRHRAARPRQDAAAAPGRRALHRSRRPAGDQARRARPGQCRPRQLRHRARI